MKLQSRVYKKIGGFALMLGALFFAAGTEMVRQNISPNHTLRVSVETIPYIQAHEHPEGDPDAPHAHWYSSPKAVLVPFDMWVTSIRAVVENASPGILHHILLYEAGAQNPICPNTFRKIRELFAASRNTVHDPVIFDEPYSIYLKEGTSLVVDAMEHTAFPPEGPGGIYTNVEIAVELDYIPAKYAKERTQKLEFYRLRLDDSPCSYPILHEAFVVPKGKGVFVKKPDTKNVFDGGWYRFEKPGNIIGFGANFWPWKGGKVVRAVLNGKEVASLTALKLSDAWAWSIPQHNISVRIEKGDIIEAYAEYENPYTDKDILDASGMLGFYFAPRDKVSE